MQDARRVKPGRTKLSNAGRMPGVVDPEPIIEARLRALAAEHEPALAALDRAIAAAAPKEARSLRAERRRAKRKYRTARREVEKLRRHGVTW